MSQYSYKVPIRTPLCHGFNIQCENTHTFTCIHYIHIYACAFIHPYISTYIYIYTHTNTCAQIYTCTHRYTHMWRECIRSIFYTKKKKILLKYKSYEERNMLYTFKLPNFAYSISLLSLSVTNSSLLSSQLLLQLLLSCSKICFLHSHNT